MKIIILKSLYSFLIAFGVILGGSVFVGFGAIILKEPPLKTMIDLANSIKIWAVATALGGTFNSFSILEDGIFKGELKVLIKHMIYILSALIGSNLGVKVLMSVEKCSKLWNN